MPGIIVHFVADGRQHPGTIERDLRRILWVQAIRAALYGFGSAHPSGLHRGDGRAGGTHGGRGLHQHPSVARPFGPAIGTALMQNVAFGAPFVVAGALKAVYDLVLWRVFKRVPLPEHRSQPLPPS
jgi:hypothetical protein